MVPVVSILAAPLLSPRLAERQQAVWPGARGTAPLRGAGRRALHMGGRTFTARPEHGLVPSHAFPPDRLGPM